MNKATRAQVKRHNRRLVLRAIFEKLADNRAALALETGLTKPTIGTIVSELIDNGYVIEDGYGTSTGAGGKRPTLIRFVPSARQVIGVTMNADEVLAGLAYLDGTVIAWHRVPVCEGDDRIAALHHAINGLRVQCDAELICIGVGLPGIVDTDSGVVARSPSLQWEDVKLAENLTSEYGCPSYIANNTALTTLVQSIESDGVNNCLVTVSIGDTIEIGTTLGREIYHHGGDIDALPIGNDATVSALKWANIKRAAQEIIANDPTSLLTSRKFQFLLLRRAVFSGEARAQQLLQTIARDLAHIYAWIIGLLRPDEIVLAGPISELGDALIELTREELRALQSDTALNHVHLTLASSNHLSLREQ